MITCLFLIALERLAMDSLSFMTFIPPPIHISSTRRKKNNMETTQICRTHEKCNQKIATSVLAKDLEAHLGIKTWIRVTLVLKIP